MKVYYFGCHQYPGHYMHRVGMSLDWEFLERNPWGTSVDGGLCPGVNEKGEAWRVQNQIEGAATLHHKDGWTALSFWDRSIDKRNACNSAFLAEGTHTFDEMLVIAREHFPTVMARFTFPIVPAESIKP
jgi:hypothetical protein